ncbi:MAG: LamG-like jellyroll fold domain-containing protein [Candidatus Micrarchaeaceae archaeon]
MEGGKAAGKAQIALEFLIVYSFVLIIFILIFSIISTQRAASLGQQEYSLLQLQSQNIASYIDQAVQAGSGYSATVPLVSGLTNNYYNLSISNTGVVIAGTKIGSQPIRAYGFGHARSFAINGTLVASSGGIGIYQIPTYSGRISIYNYKGTIYIDEIPVSLVGLEQGAVLTQYANVRAPSFNGQDGYIETNGVVNEGGSGTVTAWIYPTSFNGMARGIASTLMYIGAPDNSLQCGFGGTNTGINYGLSLDKWVFIACTYNQNTGTETFYSNGTAVGTAHVNSNDNYIAINIGASQSLSDPFQGMISDVQIYNITLSDSQINQLYSESIDAQPLPYNVTGWWPLDGNANDYSGMGRSGAQSQSVVYNGLIAANLYAYSGSNSISNVLIGFVASKGNINGNINYSTLTGTGGAASAYINRVSTYGSGNLSADVFNGNITTVGNLIGWWPLDTGYGANIIDLSFQGDPGTLNGMWEWQQSINETNFAAAMFPGSNNNNAAHQGYVTVNSSQPLLGIVANNTFTVVAWIYWNGSTPSHSQGIFGNWPGSGGGFQLFGYCNASCTNDAALYVDGNYLDFPTGYNAFPEGKWEMVTAQYDGYTGATTVYLNSTVYASTTLPVELDLLQSGNYFIGNEALQPFGSGTFNGSITDVQLYDRYLTRQQIGSLYDLGISALPLSSSGLIGWWPLIGNVSDYSNNQDTGIEIGNVTYANSAYNNTAVAVGPDYVTFNGAGNVIIPYSAKLAASKYFSVSAWFLTNSQPSSKFDYELVDARQPGDYTYDMQLCGGGDCGIGSGIHGSVGTGSYWLNMAVNYNFSFMPNTWYNVLETFNTTQGVIYLDGNKVETVSYNGNVGIPLLLNQNNYVEIGGGQGDAGATGFVGQLADVQVYNSVLTPLQAMQLYVQGLPQQERINISLD